MSCFFLMHQLPHRPGVNRHSLLSSPTPIRTHCCPQGQPCPSWDPSFHPALISLQDMPPQHCSGISIMALMGKAIPPPLSTQSFLLY